MFRSLLPIIYVTIFMLSFASFSLSLVTHANSVQEYIIAWSDVGPPQPFTGYPYGPIFPVLTLMFDTLAWYGKNGIIPLLAESWEQVNGTTWIIKLRKGVMWQDGKPLTAEDIVFSINYTKYVNNKIIPIWWVSSWINLIKSVNAINNYTVEITFNTTIPSNVVLMKIFTNMFIIPKHIWENVTNPRGFTGPEAYIGTGPYKLVKYEPGMEYVFTANDNYFLGKPTVQTLILKVVPTTQQIEYMTMDEVDAASFSSYYNAKPLLGNPMFNFTAFGGGLAYVLVFNLNKYPFNITDFRMVIAYAINYTAIYEKLGGAPAGWASVGPNIVPPYSPYYNDSYGYNYSLGKAISILESLGYKYTNKELLDKNGNQLSITLTVPDDPIAQTIGLIVEQDLESIGIAVTIKSIPSNLRTQILSEGNFEIMINIYGGLLSPYQWSFNVKGSVHYVPGYNSTKLLGIESKAFLSSYNERVKLLNEFQAIVTNDVPVIVLFWPKFYWVYNSEVGINGWFFDYKYEYGPPWILNKLVLIEGYQSMTNTTTLTTKGTPTIPSNSQSPSQSLIIPIIGVVIVIIGIIVWRYIFFKR
ncbi:ABC transporter substrate-binding protein [Saccharolobus islandicus]|uniref:Extracellular solute-binding protein, family 5 n=1 Tax=Saccharolobus islandicus (strain HVE10/4) TaxID=930943 RepID=F0NP70_SACI0|nr:ABC transporter substrate-binding protein [Sulfolobus islandicus]ADX82256.1 extracellular solute-binding protein, family 5 [Sulfolobus islandicus HVE10/4]